MGRVIEQSCPLFSCPNSFLETRQKVGPTKARLLAILLSVRFPVPTRFLTKKGPHNIC